MNFSSWPQAVNDWIASWGIAAIVAFVVAVIGAAALLLNGWRQRRHDTLAAVKKASRDDRQRMRDRLAPRIDELMQVSDDMIHLASVLTHRPDDGVLAAPDAIRAARRRLDLVRDGDLRKVRDELIAINGRLVQWSGILRGLRNDAQAGRPFSPTLGQKVDELEDEVGARLEEVRKVLDALLQALNQ